VFNLNCALVLLVLVPEAQEHIQSKRYYIMSAFSNRQSIKDMNDQINDASSGDTILASIDEEIASLSSSNVGKGKAFLDKALEDSEDNVKAMKRRALGARNTLTKTIKPDPVFDSNASLARDWLTASKADEEAESEGIIQALSDKIAAQSAALITAESSMDENFLRTGRLDNVSTLTQDPDSIRTDAERIEDSQFLSGSGVGIEDRIFAPEPIGLSDDDMGLPDYERSAFMAPNSLFRTALKEKEAGSYSTLFGDAEKNNTSNVDLSGLAVNSFKGIDITTMPMSEVMDFVKIKGDFHKYNLARTNPKDGKPKPVNTTAIGKYQFVGATLRDLKKRGVFKKLGITDDTLFDESTQDALSEYLAIHRIRDRGDGTMSGARKEMRNEWEGFKKLSDSRLDSIINEISSEIGVSIGGTKLSPRESLRPKERPAGLGMRPKARPAGLGI